MVDWDSGDTLAERMRSHAGTAEHLYGVAMRAMADDWESGGPVRAVCSGYENAPSGSVIQLRLLAGVFRLVLTGRAEELLPFYPCLGGEASPADSWPLMRDAIARHQVELHDALAIPPQTNEVGRSVALLAGLFDLVAATGQRRIRLLEVGASAGLNLLVDEFRFSGDGWEYGPPDSELVIDHAIIGPVRPAGFEIVERRGCDVDPVDASTPDGRQFLTSFVWPFDLHRHRRLAAALRVADSHPVTVDRASASDWLADQLMVTDHDALTVVWHSITQLYWPQAEVDAVDALLERHGSEGRLARVSMEFDLDADASARHSSSDSVLSTSLFRPGQGMRRMILGTAHHHGPPVRLGDPRDAPPG